MKVKLQIKGVKHPLTLFLETLCIFSENKHLWTKYPIDLAGKKFFQGPQKSQFYFSRDDCCEVTVKNVRKSTCDLIKGNESHVGNIQF